MTAFERLQAMRADDERAERVFAMVIAVAAAMVVAIYGR